MSELAVYRCVADLEAAVGVEVGPTAWLTVEQARVDRFAEATANPRRTQVDGFLTLSLLPYVNGLLRRIENVRMGVNYGLDQVRFPAPVPVGSRVRGRLTLLRCERLGDGDAVQLVTRAVIEVEGIEEPACIAELVSRYYFR